MKKSTLIKIVSGVVVVASLVATTTLFISHKLKHKKVEKPNNKNDNENDLEDNKCEETKTEEFSEVNDITHDEINNTNDKENDLEDSKCEETKTEKFSELNDITHDEIDNKNIKVNKKQGTNKIKGKSKKAYEKHDRIDHYNFDLIELERNPDEEKINEAAKYIIRDLKEEITNEKLFIQSGQTVKDYNICAGFDLLDDAIDIIPLLKNEETAKEIQKLLDEIASLRVEYNRIHGRDNTIYL